MFVRRIWVYPIKSLDGVEVATARVTSAGSLEHDRTFAIVDADGRVLNGKRTPRVHALRSDYSEDFAEVRFWTADEPRRQAFALAEPAACGRWLAEFFGFPVRLTVDREKGFPDDEKASGPTIVSEASLEEVQRWFPELSLDNVRRRFRSNVELGGCGAFGEDRMFGGADVLRPFRMGEVRFLGSNPCQRCAVPARDPDTGEVTPGFQKRFMEEREKSLPAWANQSRFNHYYRLAVNTSIPPSESGKWIRSGDVVELG